jgi:hypothetical protein
MVPPSPKKIPTAEGRPTDTTSVFWVCFILEGGVYPVELPTIPPDQTPSLSPNLSLLAEVFTCGEIETTNNKNQKDGVAPGR